jgi:molybdate transport system regulatory protein
MTRYPGLTLRILRKRRPAIGPGKAALVEHIAQTGSISAAARAMGMSYRRAWQLVEGLNRACREPVVLTAIGGKQGGGAAVTPFGLRLVRLFRAMEGKASKSVATDLKRLESYLR